MFSGLFASLILLIAALIHSSKSANTMCPSSSSTVDDAGRMTMLNANNNYRSILVKGQQPDSNGTNNSAGCNMYMMIYDCGLEAEAQLWANSCVWRHSMPPIRTNQGENLFVYSINSTNSTAMFQMAADLWWAEVTQNWTTRSNNVFNWTTDEPAGHFTQMAWGNTYKVGCGMQVCPSMMQLSGWPTSTIIVCRYVNAGNYIGQPVYTPASSGACTPDACNTPSLPSTLNSTTGLCVINGMMGATPAATTESTAN